MHGYYFVKRGEKVVGPMTVEQLNKLIDQKQVDLMDQVRSEYDKQWITVKKFLNPNEGQSYSDTIDAVKTPKEPQPPKIKHSSPLKMVLWLIILIGLPAGGGVYFFYFNPSGIALRSPEEAAKAVLVAELDKWIRAEEPELHDRLMIYMGGIKFSRPILIEYKILSVKAISPGKEYRALVNLTFTTKAGGRPVEQYSYQITHQDTGWKIEGEL